MASLEESCLKARLGVCTQCRITADVKCLPFRIKGLTASSMSTTRHNRGRGAKYVKIMEE